MEPNLKKQTGQSARGSSTRLIPKRSYSGVFMVLCLVSVTLYMAFAFPYSLFHLKQTETTEIKSVIIVARNGERSPSPESYFIGEEQPDQLINLGYEQLTNTGKERMYLLGKYLKLRYYQLLLNGDPRKVYVRSADSDRCLESAEALLAGLNPPKDGWIWSSNGDLENWQPKAIHSTAAADDDLLSAESECLKLEDKLAWKNSTRYQQLLNEFRHDLQTLRSNTGLEFEDDLEMLSNLEDALKTRKAFNDDVPNWYTNTLSNRLAHISDVAAESRFSLASVQRLYVGRLLYEIARNINSKIRLLSLTANSESNSITNNRIKGSYSKIPRAKSIDSEASGSAKNEHGNDNDNDDDDGDRDPDGDRDGDHEPSLSVQQKQKNKLRVSNPSTGPNMFIYLTSKNRLTALMNSLQVYSSQPPFGSMLLIELHYDPINQIHFLRLFTVTSNSASSLPEPLRVNPKACLDSVECIPQQFEQNIRHLMLDKSSWQEACSFLNTNNYQLGQNFVTSKPQPLWPTSLTDNQKPTTAIPVTKPSTITIESQNGNSLDDNPIVIQLEDKKDNLSATQMQLEASKSTTTTSKRPNDDDSIPEVISASTISDDEANTTITEATYL